MLHFLRRLIRGELFQRVPRYATLEELWAGVPAMINRLDQLGCADAATELRNGYGALNGLTDGWAAFRDSVDRVWHTTSARLGPEDRHALARIRASARYAMRRR